MKAEKKRQKKANNSKKKAYLGYSLVIDVDQISWSRIDLECAVEA